MRAHIRDAIALGITTALLGAVREYGRPIEVALPIGCAASVARQDQFGFGLVIAVGDGRMVHDRFSYRKPFFCNVLAARPGPALLKVWSRR